MEQDVNNYPCCHRQTKKEECHTHDESDQRLPLGDVPEVTFQLVSHGSDQSFGHHKLQ